VIDVASTELHAFRNPGEQPLRFLCLVPNRQPPTYESGGKTPPKSAPASGRSVVEKTGLKHTTYPLALLAIASGVWLASGCERLPTAPPLPAVRADFQKGMTFVCWSPGCLDRDVARQAMADIAATGSNWLAIVPTWYQKALDTAEIEAHPSLSPTDHELRVTIRRAHASGYRVLLKPHVDVLTGEWRGKIRPRNVAKWFASYREFLLHFARLAEDEAVEQLAVGTELAAMSRDDSPWRDLIAETRGQFSGVLTYAANWDEFERVPFWDDLDLVGIDGFFPLTNNPDAGLGEMLVGWRFWIQRLRTWQAGIGKEIVFTEIGYTSQDGTNMRPFDFDISDRIDLQEQADAYRAALITLQGQSWVRGIFWWMWDPGRTGGPNDRGYTPYGKPAQDELATAWNQGRGIGD